MAYRLFHLKVVPNDRPNSDGRWIERVVPDEWPGDDHAQEHMLRAAPGYDYVPSPGFHVVAISEASPGPADQPGSMREMAGFAAGEFAPAQDTSFGMRP
jgi:hypothetical protein